MYCDLKLKRVHSLWFYTCISMVNTIEEWLSSCGRWAVCTCVLAFALGLVCGLRFIRDNYYKLWLHAINTGRCTHVSLGQCVSRSRKCNTCGSHHTMHITSAMTFSYGADITLTFTAK